MSQTVLVIDDSESIHHLIQVMLQNERLNLRFELDGCAGIVTARKNPPDLILLDVDMPAPNGFEVCSILKSDPTTMNVPIVFLTAVSCVRQKIYGLDLGAVDYVTKPFESGELRARVAAALRTKGTIDVLAQRAMIDGLTGLWNRRYFDQRLEAELSAALRQDSRVACIMADVDRFKSINDTYGHAMGDEVLKGVSSTITAAVRSEDVVARFGGEEFAILTKSTPDQSPIALAERLRLEIERYPFEVRGKRIHVTSSFGVAESGPVGESIVERADAALYRAKHNGRNRVEHSLGASKGSRAKVA